MSDLLQTVAVGKDRNLWHVMRFENGTWQRGMGLVEAPVAGGPAGFLGVGCAGTGESLHVVGLGTDNQLWYALRKPDTTWTPQFEAIAGGPGGGFKALACAVAGTDLQVVGVGADNRLWHSIRTGNRWS